MLTITKVALTVTAHIIIMHMHMPSRYEYGDRSRSMLNAQISSLLYLMLCPCLILV